MEGVGGVQAGSGEGEAVEILEGDAGLEEGGGVGQRPEAVMGCGDLVLGVALADAAVGPRDLGGEEAGPVEVEEGGERVAQEGVDEGSEVAGDVGVAEPLADHAAVLGLDEGVVVGAAGPGLGELADVEFGEEPGDAVVDVLRAVVGVEAGDLEGEGGDEGFELGEEEVLGDAADGAKVLELRDFVDDVDDVDALLSAAVALVDGVDAQESGPSAGAGLAPGADGDPGGARPAQGEAAGAVGSGLPEVVDVAVGDGGEAPEARIAVDLELTPQELLGGGPGEVAAELVDLGQQSDVVRSVAAREGTGRGLAAAVADVAGPAMLGDQPGELGGRQAGHLARKLSEQALGGSPEAVVAEAEQRPADEGVGGGAVGEVDLDRVVAFQKGPDLVQGANLFGVAPL